MRRNFFSALPTSKRRFATIAFLLALLVLCCVQAGAQTSYADYPQKRGKTQGLAWEPLPSWMSIALEVRSRTEGQTSFGYVQNGDRTYDLTRAKGSLEVRPSRYVTGYMEFMDGHALGLPLHAVSSNMRDVFDLRQGWLNVHANAGRVPISAIAGRQELKFGSERIIGVSDWTNDTRSWDGFDLRIGDRNRVDLFSTSVVAIHPSSLDTHGAGLTFHGAYGSLTHFIPHVHLSPYVLFHDVRGVTSLNGVKGNEVETTFGSEIQGKLPAHFCYMANGSLQRGSYSSDSIRAGQAFGKVYYTASSIFWQPRLGVEYDYATGNDHSNPTRHATYDQQYPSNHNAFGNVDLFGYQNIRQERINLDIAPAPSFTVLVQGGFLNVAERKDSLYSGSGSATIKAPTAGFASSVIGQEFDVSGKYVFHDYLVANVGAGHLFPGALLLQNKHGSAETIGYFGLTYRLRVDRVKADR
jgi:hypothetical protein